MTIETKTLSIPAETQMGDGQTPDPWLVRFMESAGGLCVGQLLTPSGETAAPDAVQAFSFSVACRPESPCSYLAAGRVLPANPAVRVPQDSRENRGVFAEARQALLLVEEGLVRAMAAVAVDPGGKFTVVQIEQGMSGRDLARNGVETKEPEPRAGIAYVDTLIKACETIAADMGYTGVFISPKPGEANKAVAERLGYLVITERGDWVKPVGLPARLTGNEPSILQAE